MNYHESSIILHEFSKTNVAVQQSPPTQSYGAAVVFVRLAAPDQLCKDEAVLAAIGMRENRNR